MTNIRIIAGEFGGRKLDAPKGRRTHPMGERVRGALFNSIAAEIDNAIVLDIYAGSGALGLEALSRGAQKVTFVEKDRIAQKAIANNIAVLGVDERAMLVRAPASSFIATTDQQYDIIFADPPYYSVEQHLSTIERIFGLLKPGALMVLSYPDRCEVKPTIGIVVVDNRRYGNANLAFYRRKT